MSEQKNDITQDSNKNVTSDIKLRFGCANNVGVSAWAEELQITLPKPGKISKIKSSSTTMSEVLFKISMLSPPQSLNYKNVGGRGAAYCRQ